MGAEDQAYSVVQITDTHLRNLEGYDPEFAKRRRSLCNSFSASKEFLETIGRRTDVSAVVITGDLVDYYEAETMAGPLRATRIEQWLELVHSCPADPFLTLGNHDLTSYRFEERENAVRSFQYHAHQARAPWARNLPCYRDGTYYARTIEAGATRYQFLFLDNGYGLGSGDIIDPIQSDWLTHRLRLAGKDPVVIFMHRYLGVADLNGDGNAFSRAGDLTGKDTPAPAALARGHVIAGLGAIHPAGTSRAVCRPGILQRRQRPQDPVAYLHQQSRSCNPPAPLAEVRQDRLQGIRGQRQLQFPADLAEAPYVRRTRAAERIHVVACHK